jgi:hypothetical protein
VARDSVHLEVGQVPRVIAAALLAVSLSLASAQERCPEPTPPPVPRPDAPLVMPEDLRIGLFNTVWQAVNDFYLFEDFGGVDWDGDLPRVRSRRCCSSRTPGSSTTCSTRMVGELDDPLTTFVNPLVLEAIAAQEATYGGIGALLDRGAVDPPGETLRVVAVFPGSPAEAAGLRPRDRILAVDGDDCPRTEIIRGPADTTGAAAGRVARRGTARAVDRARHARGPDPARSAPDRPRRRPVRLPAPGHPRRRGDRASDRGGDGGLHRSAPG